MLVKELMASPVITVKSNNTLEHVAKIMIKNRIGCLPVVDNEGKMLGIITEAEFTAEKSTFPFSRVNAPKLFGKWMLKENIEDMYKSAKTMKAEEIMNTSYVYVDKDDSVFDLLNIMIDNNVFRMPVLKDGKPVGIITRHDLLKLIIDSGHQT
ncbi:MAG: CBS domain-containing protein [Deltaproteobacteria bacterium]|nr:CBS domain-containing protein [Candidatus Dadabacteria bacterium]TDJ08017.1 MAG: CBS domain-containing protein [Deltaproteobacteria bacterium]